MMAAEPSWVFLKRDAVSLACRDFGGDGPPVVLLHGLAGHAGEWSDTAGSLTERFRVIALDARGHGQSERTPRDVSRAAHVADTVFTIEALQLGPVGLVGQSLGGLTALLVAAEHPKTVRGLVVADASPTSDGDVVVADVAKWLARWPVPFATRDAAVQFFGGPSLAAEAWVDGLDQRDSGWWPRFDPEVMVRTIRDAVSRSYWQHWEHIRCPTLVVRAGNGSVSAATAREMVQRLPGAQLAEIAHAKHDLHLDRAAEWRELLSQFLASLNDAPLHRENGSP